MSSGPFDPYGVFNRKANERKLQLYWLGFIEGVVASGDIEQHEPEALSVEVNALLPVISDPYLEDLYEDLKAQCFESCDDLMETLSTNREHLSSIVGCETEFQAKDHVTRFRGFCAGIGCDGVLLEAEVDQLESRLIQLDRLADDPMLEALRAAITRIRQSGNLSPALRTELANALSDLVGDCYADTGLATYGQVSKSKDQAITAAGVDARGRKFVITGTTKLSRYSLQSLICSAGGEVQRYVTRDTSYIVCGETCSPSWKSTSHGRKMEKAQALIAKGVRIKFVPEHELVAALGS